MTSHCTCLPALPPRPMNLLQKQHMGTPCRSWSVHPAFQPLREGWGLARVKFGLGKIYNPGPRPPLQKLGSVPAGGCREQKAYLAERCEENSVREGGCYLPKD